MLNIVLYIYLCYRICLLGLLYWWSYVSGPLNSLSNLTCLHEFLICCIMQSLLLCQRDPYRAETPAFSDVSPSLICPLGFRLGLMSSPILTDWSRMM